MRNYSDRIIEMDSVKMSSEVVDQQSMLYYLVGGLTGLAKHHEISGMEITLNDLHSILMNASRMAEKKK